MEDAADTEMVLLEAEGPLEKLFRLSKELSEDSTESESTKRRSTSDFLNLGNETIYIYN